MIFQSSRLHLLHPSLLLHCFSSALWLRKQQTTSLQTQSHTTTTIFETHLSTGIDMVLIVDLSEDVFIHFLSYLTPEELSHCNSVDTIFSHRVHHNSLWKYWLQRCFGIEQYDSLEYPPGYPHDLITNTCINCFVAWKSSFSGYSSHDISRTRIWWKRFESWCGQYAPEILTTLNGPVSELEINEVERKLNCSLPSSLKLFYRFHNGQSVPFDRNRTSHESIGWGLFGGTHFYDSFTSLRFSPINLLRDRTISWRSYQRSIFPHPKCLGINPNVRTTEGHTISLVDNDFYYEDDDINGPLSNHLPDSTRVPVDTSQDLFLFAHNAIRPPKVYCIGSDHPSNSRGGVVYVNTSELIRST